MKRTLEELLEELKDKGVSEKTLNAMRIIKREYFVINKEEAYLNEALPFLNQTTSQPLVIANVIDELDLTTEDVVIEAGTGSGYQTCLLALLSKKVHSFEIDKQIFEKGKENILNFIKQHPHLKMEITLYRKDIFN
ncbi:MAG: protein-L-isoaspartate O-methyltransferase family protein, partial [bacterium]